MRRLIFITLLAICSTSLGQDGPTTPVPPVPSEAQLAPHLLPELEARLWVLEFFREWQAKELASTTTEWGLMVEARENAQDDPDGRAFRILDARCLLLTFRIRAMQGALDDDELEIFELKQEIKRLKGLAE